MKMIKGNILNVRYGILAHGCNCSNVFNKGLAKSIKEKYPKVYDYFMTCPTGPEMLGEVRFVRVNQVPPYLTVANCYAQVYCGKHKPYRGNCHLDYEALNKCLNRVFEVSAFSGESLHFPRLGCGLAGGDWKVVSEMIKGMENEYKVESNVYEID